MKTLLTALLLLALPLGAAAQRHYAILSLVGDELVIVQRDFETGSRLDTNARQAIQMKTWWTTATERHRANHEVSTSPSHAPRPSAGAANPPATGRRAVR